MFFSEQPNFTAGHYCSLTIGDSTAVDKVYNVTLCTTPTYTESLMESSLISAEEMEELLDEIGCSDDVEEALELKRGGTLLLGFPQASFHGAIVTRIL